MNILFIIFGILFFNLIIFFHEFGHFFTAKTFGVKVNEFALGMGPRVFKFKKGDTIFSLRALPLGGFCAMEGEDEASNDPNAFEKKAAWKKFIIVSAGAIMNLVLGFLMTIFLVSQQTTMHTTKIENFYPEAVSSNYGLMVGDEILSIDSRKIFSSKDLLFDLGTYKKNQFDFKVKRNGEIIELKDVTFNTKTNENGKNSLLLDFSLQSEEKNLVNIFKHTWNQTLSAIKIVWSSLTGMLTGRFSIKDMSGPIGIVSAIGDATNEGLKTSVFVAFINIMALMALITINLGVFNLLPLPALDGGRLMFLLFEMITHKKLNPKYEGFIHTLGFFLFIAFTIYISYADILRLLGKS